MYIIMIGKFCVFVVAAAVHKSTQDYESLNGYELYQLYTAHTVLCRLLSNVHIQNLKFQVFTWARATHQALRHNNKMNSVDF